MEQSRKYFYTAGYYFDCPTCDSVASDPEDIYISPVFTTKQDLLNHISEMIPEYYFYCIYGTDEYGIILPLVTNIVNHNSGHRVQHIRFNWDNKIYTFNSVGLLTEEEVKDEQTNRPA